MYSGLQYMGGMNNYMFDTSQYGVNMYGDGSDDTQSANKGMMSLMKLIPYVGPILGAVGNFASMAYQNSKQEQFYNKYMSPAARMQQMREAGINPNAAAQGIAGSSAPQMTAATPNNAFGQLGEVLGNSANTALSADLIESETKEHNSNAALADSLNVEKTITNKYLDEQQQAVLNKLIQEGRIDKSTANMLEVDEAYKPQTAFASYQQLIKNLTIADKQIDLLCAQTIDEYAKAYQAFQAGNLSEAQIHKVFSDIGLNNAMIKKIAYECDVLEATETSIYQDITESKARTTALEIQNKFQQDYYDIWNNTGFNWNSDIEKSIVGCYSNMQLDEGDRLMTGLKTYVVGTGDARAGSTDFIVDKLFQGIGMVSSLGGSYIMAGAHRYGADVSAGAQRYSADKHLEGMQQFGKQSPRFRRKIFP